MGKTNLTIAVETEKLEALAIFLSKKENSTPQKEFEQVIDQLYEKYVPGEVREYIDHRAKKAPAPRPKAKTPVRSPSAPREVKT